jgi:hypothetical protein
MYVICRPEQLSPTETPKSQTRLPADETDGATRNRQVTNLTNSHTAQLTDTVCEPLQLPHLIPVDYAMLLSTTQ